MHLDSARTLRAAHTSPLSHIPWQYGEHLYVCDTGHHCIKVFTTGGEYVRRWGKPSGPDSADGSGSMDHPSGIAIFGKHVFVTQQVGVPDPHLS